MKNEKKAVLIAEDEEINRTILREILKDKYRVLEAETVPRLFTAFREWLMPFHSLFLTFICQSWMALG